MRIPEPEELHALFKLMGYAPVARHKTKKITVYRQGDINYLVNEAARHPRPQLRRRARAVRAVDGVSRRRCEAGLRARAVARRRAGGYPRRAEDARRSRHQGHRRQPAVFRRPLRRQGLGLRCRVRVARRARSAAGGRRAVLSRSPHPQRPSRPHGCLDRLLRKAVQLPADPLLRHRGPRLRPVLPRA